ncbi:MAG: von Willebrand factor type A domain-containing protein [Planctomycetes bacterium]|nr:von Willebrand factor type A domain-containing protein [Planctomycetota bacterium]
MVRASLRAFSMNRLIGSSFWILAAVLLVPSTGCKTEMAKAPRGDRVGAARHEAHDAKRPHDKAAPGEEYERRRDNPFHLVANDPLSTFSIDVDTASYTNVRRMLNENTLPPADAVRVEEFVNYFTYNYPAPEGEHPITLSAESAACPWNPQHQLVRIGIQGVHIDPARMPPRNLVFLVDTSGSMAAPNRLPLLKKALALLTKQLNKRDRVTIVEYAGRAGLVLPTTAGDQHATILAALDKLFAEGSTNGGDGIQMAYDLAQKSFIKGGANRVILGTDGDFNVGLTGAELIRFIEQKRDTGVFLTVLGFGMGNYKDATLEKLAQHGNGTHAYIDSMAEAQRVFVEQIANLVPIANDVKVQVEFNPAHVQAYRLIGYENRLLNHQDFNDDTKDAGDMGAGHTVTALYEIVPHGVQIQVPGTSSLKYQEKSKLTLDANSNELITVNVRYLPPTQKQSKLVTAAIDRQSRPFAEASRDFRFAAAVASFAMLLRESPHKGETSFAQVHQWAKTATGPDELGHRREFLRLVQTAERLANQQKR